MVKIYFHMPWDENGDIGKSMNEHLLNVHWTKHEDWIAFYDYDCMFTTKDWYKQMIQVIESNPKCKGITARINRMATQEMMVAGVDPFNFDYSYHRRVGQRLAKKHFGQSSTISTPGHFSGTFFAVHIKTIKDLGGFPETGDIMGHDQLIHKMIVEAGHEWRVCDGVYIFHWYKADEPYEHSKAAIQSLEDYHLNQLKLTKEVKHA